VPDLAGLRVVGIDTLEDALRLADENVHEADMSNRIELRLQAVEVLPDRAAFDLALLPVRFMAADVLPAAVERAHAALRRGGWLIVTVRPSSPDPLEEAALKLQGLVWGGEDVSADQVETLLGDADSARPSGWRTRRDGRRRPAPLNGRRGRPRSGFSPPSSWCDSVWGPWGPVTAL